MKVFSAAQIKACDAYTVHADNISSLQLMERAAHACVNHINEHYKRDALFIVLCGTGNNGGDGLAITRLLHQQGYGVKAFLLQINPELAEDCAANLKRLRDIDPSLVDILKRDTFITDISPQIVFIDAIFGTGLNRTPDGWIKAFITYINNTPNKKVAIDIPSGMPADNMAEDMDAIMVADETLSFQFYKRSFLHPEIGEKAGNVHLLDIDLHETFIASTHSSYQTIDEDVIATIYKKRKGFSHKGDYGHAMLIGGSYGMCGAISLSTKAACKAGAGKVTTLLPECGYNIIQTLVPEAMCMTRGEKNISRICDWEKMDAIGIGPGLGNKQETLLTFVNFIEVCKRPIVIDADALNMLASQPELIYKVPAGSILTPHPKEFERLFGQSVDSMQQLELARTQAMKYNVFIILKGRYTAVITPEGECWYNITGNPGMATGGSGDVLTGIITVLMAQGYTSYESAILGVYLHGLAGDHAANASSQEAMVAGDIIDNLGAAFKMISSYSNS